MQAAAVGLPCALLARFTDFTRGALPILIWGGLRGGIANALALSLPPVPAKDPILTATYIVVLISVVVQGNTVGTAAHRLVGPSSDATAK